MTNRLCSSHCRCLGEGSAGVGLDWVRGEIGTEWPGRKMSSCRARSALSADTHFGRPDVCAMGEACYVRLRPVVYPRLRVGTHAGDRTVQRRWQLEVPRTRGEAAPGPLSGRAPSDDDDGPSSGAAAAPRTEDDW